MDQKHSSKKSALSSVPSKDMQSFRAELRAAIQASKPAPNSAKRKRAKARVSRQNQMGSGVSSRVVDAPAARVTRLDSVTVGLSDRTEVMSFKTGTVAVGQDSVLGSSGSVYFRDLAGTVWNGIMPIFLNDTANVRVPSYITDAIKHFARSQILDAELDFLPTSSATSVGTTVKVGPVRGSVFPLGTSATTGSLAKNTTSTVLGMAGSQQFGSWERSRVPLKSCIAGGAGAAQNEFSVSNSGWGSATASASNTGGFAGFAISGDSTEAAARDTHDVIVRMKVKLLDFIGGFAATSSVGVQTRGSDEKKMGSTNPSASATATGERDVPLRERSRPPAVRASELESTPIQIERPDRSGGLDTSKPGQNRPGWFG